MGAVQAAAQCGRECATCPPPTSILRGRPPPLRCTGVRRRPPFLQRRVPHARWATAAAAETTAAAVDAVDTRPRSASSRYKPDYSQGKHTVPVRRVPTHSDEQRWRLFLQKVLRGEYGDPIVGAVWDKELRSTTCNTAIRQVLIVNILRAAGTVHPFTAAPALLRLCRRRFSDAAYVFSESAVCGLLTVCVHRAENALRRDGPLVAPERPVWQEMLAARRLFAWLQQGEHEVKLRAWTRIIQLHSTLRQARQAQQYCRQMVAAGINPDPHVMSMVLVACKASRESTRKHMRERLHADALAVWEQMGTLRVHPDERCYESFIAVMASCGDRRRAVASFKEMMHFGVRPSNRAYASLITAAETAEQVQELVNGMADAGLSVDAHVYDAVLNALRRTRPQDTQAAEAVLSAAQAEGVQPDTCMWQTLLYSYREAGDAKGACNCLRRMAAACEPTATAAVAALGACLKGVVEGGGPDQEALRQAAWVWALCQRNPRRTFNEYTYGLMISIHLKAGNYSECNLLFGRMTAEGRHITSRHLEMMAAVHRATGEHARAAAIERLPAYREAKRNQAAREQRSARPTESDLHCPGRRRGVLPAGREVGAESGAPAAVEPAVASPEAEARPTAPWAPVRTTTERRLSKGHPAAVGADPLSDGLATAADEIDASHRARFLRERSEELAAAAAAGRGPAAAAGGKRPRYAIESVLGL
eukprot:TRINITY_DN10270_c0_g3_i1.p1 TRINITY_DN10270_c0_g3~~TRINITY_DN10270_c0_g3_i1.p1  ORF type:complete len:705 (+),score=103.97 TRINITY_DN10270_c0_g3_i1:144-2258(+)